MQIISHFKTKQKFGVCIILVTLPVYDPEILGVHPLAF